jgi:hypothetical protein
MYLIKQSTYLSESSKKHVQGKYIAGASAYEWFLIC